jgi:hypothetical protein
MPGYSDFDMSLPPAVYTSDISVVFGVERALVAMRYSRGSLKDYLVGLKQSKSQKVYRLELRHLDKRDNVIF